MYSLLKWSLFRGHVNFQGCIPLGDEDITPSPQVFVKPHLAGRDEHLGTHEGYACWCQGPPGFFQRFDSERGGPSSVKLFLEDKDSETYEISTSFDGLESSMDRFQPR